MSEQAYFVFQPKPATTNNHRNRLSDISYSSFFSPDSDDIEKSCSSDEKDWFKTGASCQFRASNACKRSGLL